MNHKFGLDRNIKKERERVFFVFQASWWPLFWETHFFSQWCAILNHSQNLSILVPETFYFFVGREVTLSSSLQHHQGNHPNSFVSTIQYLWLYTIVNSDMNVMKASLSIYIKMHLNSGKTDTDDNKHVCIIHCNHKCKISLLNNFCHHIK